jgi:GDP-4-dehydro-6-deoxy-D-mannose reductase
MLLIGSRGFLGGHLRAAVEEAGAEVVAAVRDGANGGLSCDLRDPGSVEACVRAAAPDSIVNMAGSPSVAESYRDPLGGFAINALGVLNLLEAASRHARDAHVTCVSSAQVYGEPDERGAVFGEDDPLLPVTPYGSAKAAMEALAGQYSRGGQRIAVARLFNQLGPGQSATQATAEFARDIALAEARGDRRVELAVANPGSARDFTDARDTARALAALADGGVTGTFNVCSGRLVGLAEVIDLLGGMTDLEVVVGAPPDDSAQAGPSASVGDPSRLREATGWEPRIPLERSLADLLEYWRARRRAST